MIIFSNPDNNFRNYHHSDKILWSNIPWLILCAGSAIYSIIYSLKRKNGFYFAPIVIALLAALWVNFSDIEIYTKFAMLVVGIATGISGIFVACNNRSMLGLNGSVILIIAMILNYFFSL